MDDKLILINHDKHNKSSHNTSPNDKEPVQSTYQTRKKFIDFAKIGEKLSLTGSNCHFCKSVMTVKDSNACRFTYYLSGKTAKKKSCNKKFCFDCLEKNFPKHWNNRFNKDWKCPCCSGECFCSYCRKNLLKVKKENESFGLFNDSISESDTNQLNDRIKGDKLPLSCSYIKDELGRKENKVCI